MGKVSGIDYVTASWGPWYGGCSPQGPECEFCFAKRDMVKFGKDPAVLQRSRTTFYDPLSWKEREFVFVCPWSDFFLPAADCWREEAWDVMRRAPQHIYVIPTKRPALIPNRLPADWEGGWRNVWFLVSAGSRETIRERLPLLLQVPAVVRGLSAEPLIGDLACGEDQGFSFAEELMGWLDPFKINWVVAGGETYSPSIPSSKCRPTNPTSVRMLKRAADAAGVPFFFKSWGDWLPNTQRESCTRRRADGEVDSLFAHRCQLIQNEHGQWWRVGKKNSGCALDGREFRGRPDPDSVAFSVASVFLGAADRVGGGGGNE